MKPRDTKNGPSYCEQVVSLHGLLSRAQMQCGYTEYSQELINDFSKCIEYDLGEEYGKKVLKFGMTEFDRNEKEKGHEKICNNILKDFSQYVQTAQPLTKSSCIHNGKLFGYVSTVAGICGYEPNKNYTEKTINKKCVAQYGNKILFNSSMAAVHDFKVRISEQGKDKVCAEAYDELNWYFE